MQATGEIRNTFRFMVHAEGFGKTSQTATRKWSASNKSGIPVLHDGVGRVHQAVTSGKSNLSSQIRLLEPPNRSANASKPTGEPVSLSVPCFFRMVSPCGTLQPPVKINTVFGRFVLSSGPDLLAMATKIDRIWSRFAVIAAGSAVVLYLCTWVCLHRKEIRHAAKGVEERDTDPDDPQVTDEEKQKEKEAQLARLRIDSHNFIAPGNVYRLLAMLTPKACGGWVNYFTYAGHALVCAYMQLCLPLQLIRGTLYTWHLCGIKSFFWFATDFNEFVVSFVSLAALCFVVEGKCIESVVQGAHANYWILTHYRPESASEEEHGSSTNLGRLMEGKLAPSHKSKIFWCMLSMLSNIVMSLSLQVAIYLAVATSHGGVDKAPLTAVSIYFIFDLDNKIMDSRPHLQTLYRRHVARCTLLTDPENDPDFIQYMVGGMRIWAQMLTPVGLAAIVLFAWREQSTGFVIGGAHPLGASVLHL